jgi:hypothetical protein
MEEIFKARPKNGSFFMGPLRHLLRGKKKHNRQADEARV